MPYKHGEDEEREGETKRHQPSAKKNNEKSTSGVAVDEKDIKLSLVPINTNVTVAEALSSFQKWRDNSLKSKIVAKTDAAMMQYRGTLHLHLQDGLLDMDDASYSSTKLHTLMMSTFDILKAEDLAWTEKNPLFYLPMQLIRDGEMKMKT